MASRKSNFPDDDKFGSPHNPSTSSRRVRENTEEFEDQISFESDNEDEEQVPVRPRQRFTPEETSYLEGVYKNYERPPVQVKQELAEKFNTTVARIQIWFQNRRAKAKKMGPNPPDGPLSPLDFDLPEEQTPSKSKRSKSIISEDTDCSLSLQEQQPSKRSQKRYKSKRVVEMREPTPGPSSTSVPQPTRPTTAFPSAGPASNYQSPGYANPGYPNPRYFTNPGMYNPAYSTSNWMSQEFFASSNITPTSTGSDPSSRFAHPRNADIWWKFNPYGTRFFQELPPAYPLYPYPSYHHAYDSPSNYEELSSLERQQPPGTSYIDPQKTTYTKEFESVSILQEGETEDQPKGKQYIYMYLFRYIVANIFGRRYEKKRQSA